MKKEQPLDLLFINSHYVPELEELHIGYELEVTTSSGWSLGRFPETLNSHEELDQFTDPFIKAAHAIIKVPYLTKEQIEKEGWLPYKGMALHAFSKGIYYIWYSFESKLMSIDRQRDNHKSRLYLGPCRCINDFRKIIKLLGI